MVSTLAEGEAGCQDMETEAQLKTGWFKEKGYENGGRIWGDLDDR